MKWCQYRCLRWKKTHHISFSSHLRELTIKLNIAIIFVLNIGTVDDLSFLALKASTDTAVTELRSCKCIGPTSTWPYIPYTSSVIGRIYNGSVIQYWRSCTPSRSIGECAVPGLNAILCFFWFTNCVLLFDKNLILGCLWHLIFVWNNILILGIWCSTIPHLPGCFCPWTFFENIGFNTVQLIVLAAFGVVD